MRRLVGLCCILSIFSSCDPGHAVYLINNSSEDKEVKIVEKERTRVVAIDSVLIAGPLSKDPKPTNVKMEPITAKDITRKWYSFVLGKSQIAVLRHGTGKPDLSNIFEMIILNNNDTIVLTKDKRIKVDNGFLTMKVTILVK
jgi:hypothetical protein